jgi:CTP synthase (UTP-ammonia lyase)
VRRSAVAARGALHYKSGMGTVRIGLVGDESSSVRAHRAIPAALALAARSLGCAVEPVWVSTPQAARDGVAAVERFDGIWCVPGSPYAAMEGALAAIRFARERGRPFLGSCGGFQHAVLEYARNQLGLVEADHAESNPDAALALIAPLACSLVGESGVVRFVPGSRLRAIYGADEATEAYHCRYGISPAHEAKLAGGSLRVAAIDVEGQTRAVELDEHPFFIATLYQPELSALAGNSADAHPLIRAFVRSAAAVAGAFSGVPR